MVPFERALVSFYRLSIVTFHLSIRVSEILPLLFSGMPLFPYHTPVRAKISGCYLWSRSMMLGSAENQVAKLIIREIILEELQRMRSQSTNVTDGRTDRQLIMAIPRYATLRAVMKKQAGRRIDLGA